MIMSVEIIDGLICSANPVKKANSCLATWVVVTDMVSINILA